MTAIPARDLTPGTTVVCPDDHTVTVTVTAVPDFNIRPNRPNDNGIRAIDGRGRIAGRDDFPTFFLAAGDDPITLAD